MGLVGGKVVGEKVVGDLDPSLRWGDIRSLGVPMNELRGTPV